MEILENYPLRQHNTFGVEATAGVFCKVETAEDVQTAIKEKFFDKSLILGGGSNILLTSSEINKVVHVALPTLTLQDSDSHSVVVRCGAGVVWHEFVMYAVEQEWWGVENLALIPGSVGASPIQNIGAYGSEVADTIVEVNGFFLETGKPFSFAAADCRFQYRDSLFKNTLAGKFIITEVLFRLHRNGSPNLRYAALAEALSDIAPANLSPQSIAEAVIAIRRSKLPDPKNVGNAGSFFKNPEVPAHIADDLRQKYPSIPTFAAPNGKVKLAAAWLIEKAGWKGVVDGNTAMYHKQALVLTNHTGKATGLELLRHSQKVQKSVAEMFNIEIFPEVNIVQ